MVLLSPPESSPGTCCFVPEITTLTDDEGTFLSLLVRVGPATAYQISKIYSESPVSNFGTSKGKIYPMIRRLRSQGLIRSTPIEGDRRGSELLESSAAGIEAVRHWVKQIRPQHVLLDDPLRTKVQSFELLTPREQLQWIRQAESALIDKLAELDRYAAEVEVPFKQFVHANAVASISTRLDWLRSLARTIDGELASRPAGRRATRT
jgi:DNA-binding PadR family transcriptional regulator